LSFSIKARTHEAGKLPEAEKSLTESIAINPSNPEAQFDLAITQIQLRKWDESERALKSASALLKVLKTLPVPKGGQPSYDALLQRAEGVLAQLPAFKLRTEGDQLLADRKFDEAPRNTSRL